MGELQGELQRIVGAPGLDAQGCANLWAGTTGMDLVGALNVKAGVWGMELNGVCRLLGLTFGGSAEADGQGALAAIPGIGHGGTGWTAANANQWLSGTITNVNTATSRVVLIACVSATDWTPAATSYIGGWSNCLEVGLDTAGTVRVRVDDSGSVGRTGSSSAATGFTDGTAMIRWIAADLTDAGASGTCSFYTSTNAPNGLTNTHPGRDPSAGGAWTLSGTANRTVTSWNGTYKSATQAVLGNFGGLQGWAGRIYYLSGALNGTVPTFELNFANEPHGATVVADNNGNTFTATGSGVERGPGMRRWVRTFWVTLRWRLRR